MNNEAWLQSERWNITQNQSSRQLQAAQTATQTAGSDCVRGQHRLRPWCVASLCPGRARLAAHGCEDKNATPWMCWTQTLKIRCVLSACCRYGFGLLDAGLMVQQAAIFHTVALQRKCTQEVRFHSARWNKSVYFCYHSCLCVCVGHAYNW